MYCTTYDQCALCAHTFIIDVFFFFQLVFFSYEKKNGKRFVFLSLSLLQAHTHTHTHTIVYCRPDGIILYYTRVLSFFLSLLAVHKMSLAGWLPSSYISFTHPPPSCSLYIAAAAAAAAIRPCARKQHAVLRLFPFNNLGLPPPLLLLLLFLAIDLSTAQQQPKKKEKEKKYPCRQQQQPRLNKKTPPLIFLL